jgi:hypothetical protein
MVVVRVLVAVGIGVLILYFGVAVLRALGGRTPGRDRDAPPEDVAGLAVFFVCRECGTEFQVTRLGETQVPRHCGEKMDVVRRSSPGDALLN